jgi:hypothetical protein
MELTLDRKRRKSPTELTAVTLNALRLKTPKALLADEQKDFPVKAISTYALVLM